MSTAWNDPDVWDGDEVDGHDVLVDQVARAIYEHYYSDWPVTLKLAWADRASGAQDRWRGAARAALSVLEAEREPFFHHMRALTECARRYATTTPPGRGTPPGTLGALLSEISIVEAMLRRVVDSVELRR